MDELNKRAGSLRQDLDGVLSKLKISDLEKQAASFKKETEAADFWSRSDAQDISKRAAKLEQRLEPWRLIEGKLESVENTLKETDAEVMKDELASELDEITELIEARKDELKFSGPYDDHDAILTISAGAGGTDAQDWAQMLQRMYTRWGETEKFDVKLVDESAGEEAGIKSATLEISGNYVYGLLKGEHGVHRLVRLSPFNSDNLRQTSFAKVEVMPKVDQPADLEIDDKDLKIDVYRSGGHGGQSVNTTDSAVRVTHLPTGITVAIQNERSQLQNKETAMTILRSRLAQLQMEQHAEKLEQLKGPNQSAEWGNQIRSYVLHPYKQVKDLRTRYETSDPDAVLDGRLSELINSYLEYSLSEQ